MRIDLTTCRDPDLLAAEVRRLRGAITALADQDATLSVQGGTVNTQDQEHRMSDETKPQDSAAMSPASAGSQPVAWEVVGPHYSYVTQWREAAVAGEGVTSTPLYRQPQPTLTDKEREAIEWSMEEANSERYATLRNLLERMK